MLRSARLLALCQLLSAPASLRAHLPADQCAQSHAQSATARPLPSRPLPSPPPPPPLSTAPPPLRGGVAGEGASPTPPLRPLHFALPRCKRELTGDGRRSVLVRPSASLQLPRSHDHRPTVAFVIASALLAAHSFAPEPQLHCHPLPVSSHSLCFLLPRAVLSSCPGSW